MRINWSGCVVVTCMLLLSDIATAQQANVKCTSANPTNVAQTLQCEGEVTIVVENGAQYVLGDANHDGRINSSS